MNKLNKTGVFLLAVVLTGSLITQQAKAQSVEEIAPPAEIIPARQRSYLGIGGAIGLSGDTTALGTGGFALLSKTVFSNNLSLHNATVLFSSSISSSSTALTFDIPIRNSTSEKIVISPFLGGGIMTRNVNGFKISPHVTGGVDVPVASALTGTVRLNVGFPSDKKADMGVLVGIGYNF